MVSRYRRESASPLHLRDRNRTCTLVKLSKTIVGRRLPSLILRSFRENGSHGGVVVERNSRDRQKSRQSFPVFQHVPERLAQAAIGLRPAFGKLFLNPFAQFRHHRTAAGLMTFESLLGAHSFRFRLDPINLRDRIEHTAALRWKSPLNVDELSPRVRQTLRLDRLFLAAPIRPQRVRHLHRPAQLRAPRLQQLVEVFARMPPTVSIERDLSSSNLDYNPASMSSTPLFFLQLFVLFQAGQNLYPCVIAVNNLTICGQTA